MDVVQALRFAMSGRSSHRAGDPGSRCGRRPDGKVMLFGDGLVDQLNASDWVLDDEAAVMRAALDF